MTKITMMAKKNTTANNKLRQKSFCPQPQIGFAVVISDKIVLTFVK
jgi:hypothetical protein